MAIGLHRARHEAKKAERRQAVFAGLDRFFREQQQRANAKFGQHAWRASDRKRRERTLPNGVWCMTHRTAQGTKEVDLVGPPTLHGTDLRRDD